MKSNLIILLTLLTFGIYGQEYSKSSIEASFGITKIQDVTSFRLFNTNIGYRHMFNTKFGSKIDVGYDNNTNYYTSSLHGVNNIGRLLEFESFTDWYTVLFELGGTYVYSPEKTAGKQLFNRYSTFHLSATIDNEFKLTNNIFLNAELDFIKDVNDRPFVPSTETTNIFNINLGLTISLNNNKQHADWFIIKKQIDTVLLKPTIIDKTVTKKEIQVTKEDCNCEIIENIFFKHNSSTIDKDGLNAIVKSAEKVNEDSKIYVEGYASPPGNTNYNLKLSELRVNAVISKLLSLGIKPYQIFTQYHGEVDTLNSDNVDLVRTVRIYVK